MQMRLSREATSPSSTRLPAGLHPSIHHITTCWGLCRGSESVAPIIHSFTSLLAGWLPSSALLYSFPFTSTAVQRQCSACAGENASLQCQCGKHFIRLLTCECPCFVSKLISQIYIHAPALYIPSTLVPRLRRPAPSQKDGWAQARYLPKQVVFRPLPAAR